jgi:hypothetical protein
VVTLGELSRDEAINETTSNPAMWPGVGRRDMERACDWVLSFYDLEAERRRSRAQRDALRRARSNPLFAPLRGDTSQ